MVTQQKTRGGEVARVQCKTAAELEAFLQSEKDFRNSCKAVVDFISTNRSQDEAFLARCFVNLVSKVFGLSESGDKAGWLEFSRKELPRTHGWIYEDAVNNIVTLLGPQSVLLRMIMGSSAVFTLPRRYLSLRTQYLLDSNIGKQWLARQLVYKNSVVEVPDAKGIGRVKQIRLCSHCNSIEVRSIEHFLFLFFYYPRAHRGSASYSTSLVLSSSELNRRPSLTASKGLGFADVEKASKLLSIPYHELLVRYLENVISDTPFFDMDTFFSIMIDQWLPEADEKECSPELLSVLRASNNFRTGMSFKPQQQSVPTRLISDILSSSDHERLCACLGKEKKDNVLDKLKMPLYFFIRRWMCLCFNKLRSDQSSKRQNPYQIGLGKSDRPLIESLIDIWLLYCQPWNDKLIELKVQGTIPKSEPPKPEAPKYYSTAIGIIDSAASVWNKGKSGQSQISKDSDSKESSKVVCNLEPWSAYCSRNELFYTNLCSCFADFLKRVSAEDGDLAALLMGRFLDSFFVKSSADSNSPPMLVSESLRLGNRNASPLPSSYSPLPSASRSRLYAAKGIIDSPFSLAQPVSNPDIKEDMDELKSVLFDPKKFKESLVETCRSLKMGQAKEGVPFTIHPDKGKALSKKIRQSLGNVSSSASNEEGKTDQTPKRKVDAEPGLGAVAGIGANDFPVYQGDPMLRPISEFEFNFIAKLLVKLSMAVNSMMRLGDWSTIEERPLKIASLLYLVVWRGKHQLPLFLPTKSVAQGSGSGEVCLRIAVSSPQESLVIDCEALSPFSEVKLQVANDVQGDGSEGVLSAEAAKKVLSAQCSSWFKPSLRFKPASSKYPTKKCRVRCIVRPAEVPYQVVVTSPLGQSQNYKISIDTRKAVSRSEAIIESIKAALVYFLVWLPLSLISWYISCFRFRLNLRIFARKGITILTAIFIALLAFVVR